jgi:hypothetical protein
MAQCGGLPTRLVELHRDDGSGKCSVCSAGAQTGRYVYPCAIRTLAVRALLIQARALSRDVLHKGTAAPIA